MRETIHIFATLPNGEGGGGGDGGFEMGGGWLHSE